MKNILEDLRNNYSDEELIILAKESELVVIPEDSLLRKTSVKFYGEKDGNQVMYMTVMLPRLLLKVIVERLETGRRVFKMNTNKE